MKIAITGSNGFIVRHLVPFLTNAGHDVCVIKHTSDLNEIQAQLTGHHTELVIHLATLFIAEHSSVQVSALIDGNIKFGALLLEAMKNSGTKRLINAGTSWQHYDNETYNPTNLYAATKQALEDIARYYTEAHGFQVMNVKIFDTYGEGDTRGKIVDALLRSCVNGTEIKLSPGEQKLDLSHISDVVAAFELTIQAIPSIPSGSMRSVSLSTVNRVSLIELVEQIRNVTGKTPNVKFGARPYRDREVMVPMAKGDSLQKWQPRVSLNDGLQRLWATYV